MNLNQARNKVTTVGVSLRSIMICDQNPSDNGTFIPNLAVTEALPPDTASRFPCLWCHWCQHDYLYDEWAELFTSLLWEGVYTYSYVARAPTPGTLVVPPARAEEMYAPELFGRSSSERVVVR
jgi:alpha-2-macroglobulin